MGRLLVQIKRLQRDLLMTSKSLLKVKATYKVKNFNRDGTELFSKKMPRRTYITKEGKALRGHKPMKDKFTLLLYANASGDCKIKLHLVYHSENPHAIKQNCVLKPKLPGLQKSFSWSE